MIIQLEKNYYVIITTHLIYPYRLTPFLYAKENQVIIFRKDVLDVLKFITNKHKLDSQIQ